ncbi:aminotransferase class I/II-fold pyridoxal phosphate-dependent enzyme [Sulfoacidibacillus thermotolerans]|uniref:Aluminum resistance family protein n=1 Tax=Sulfoacidibacillus thermotolerans TaxID=1765684 RepID=A0A2U3DAX7_SULT2|nr:methionine gamma-lyase family protein [Sulfoacidibacillus thermotolerans]PWI58431.1 hypothetical protein BM613_04000 [Sulfoacidibacillus thermotolerans]
MNETKWNKIEEIERSIVHLLSQVDRLIDRNQAKVLRAFTAAKLSESDLHGSTGYGLGDRGREQLEAVYASVFGAEAAIVRPSIASGTHALAIAYFGLLRPGETLLYATGQPYDTLQAVIGTDSSATSDQGTLRDFGIGFRSIALTNDEHIDLSALLSAIDATTKVVAFQRSPGYAWRRALSVAELGVAIAQIKQRYPDLFVVVDNCYGEFTDIVEPTEVGADLVVGSLIKNPGGGLAPTGGYLVGTKTAVQLASSRLTAPGIGAEMGSYEQYRLFFQGLFLAPHIVGQAIKGNIFAAAAFQAVGLECAPQPEAAHDDIVLRIKLGTASRVVQFCQAIQQSSPIDSHVLPEPWNMPGYQDQVIMAAGTFISGASIELSADGPIRPPFVVYLQGGLTYSHVKLAIVEALDRMGLIDDYSIRKKSFIK